MSLANKDFTELVKAVRLPDDCPLPRSAQLPAGFPILLNKQTREPVAPVLYFLWEKYRRRISTANAVATDLKDWWAFLSEAPLEWTKATRSDITYYRDVMSQTVSPVTHRRYKRATVRRRVGSVQLFYEWAIQKGLAKPSVTNESAIPLAIGGEDDCVRAMSGDEIAAVFKELGPMPSDEPRSGVSARDRLLGEVSLNVGLRRAEVAALTASQIRSLRPNEAMPHGVCLLSIDKTKGLVQRTVEFPDWLILELQRYDATERAAAERASGDRQAKFFLNHATAHRAPGGPISTDTIDRVFHAAVVRAALMDPVALQRPDGEMYEGALARFGFHSLRHTFAIWMYYAEFEAGVHEPWKRVQALLGHKNLITTLKIYLRPSAAFEGMVSDAVRKRFTSIRNG